MGLAVVLGIVKSHDGMIHVESMAGVRTTFNIFYKAIRAPDQQIPQAPEPMPSGNEKILVVDDEKVMADMTKKIVERFGYTVTARTDSIEALKLIQDNLYGFDLVLTDHTMPKLTSTR